MCFKLHVIMIRIMPFLDRNFMPCNLMDMEIGVEIGINFDEVILIHISCLSLHTNLILVDLMDGIKLSRKGALMKLVTC